MNILTPVFRVSFPNVFKPKTNELSGKSEYSLVALFPKGTDLTTLKNAANAALEQKWGKNKKTWPANLKNPFRDQGDRAKTTDEGKKTLPQGYEEGGIYLNLKSETRPGIVDQKVQDILDPSEFYAGCYARATIRPYAYDTKGNKGVSFGLVNLQKVKDGDPLGWRTRPQDDFMSIQEVTNGHQSASELFG